jgi:hypothetical protein
MMTDCGVVGIVNVVVDVDCVVVVSQKYDDLMTRSVICCNTMRHNQNRCWTELYYI